MQKQQFHQQQQHLHQNEKPIVTQLLLVSAKSILLGGVVWLPGVPEVPERLFTTTAAPLFAVASTVKRKLLRCLCKSPPGADCFLVDMEKQRVRGLMLTTAL